MLMRRPRRLARPATARPDPRERPIAVFDSGVGGLTVLHELLVALPARGLPLPRRHRPLPLRRAQRRRARAVRARDRRAAADAPREAARRRLQRGERRGAAGAARAHALDHARRRGLGVIEPEALRAVAGHAHRPHRPARDADDRAQRRLRAARWRTSTRTRRSTSVACPDLAPIIQQGFPFDRRVVETVRGLLRAAARGRTSTP